MWRTNEEIRSRITHTVRFSKYIITKLFMSNWHFVAPQMYWFFEENFKENSILKAIFSLKNAYSIYCTFYSTLFSTIFSQFLSLSLSFFYTTLPKLCAFIFYARLLCYPFFLTLPDSWLLVKHAYISDGFKPATGLSVLPDGYFWIMNGASLNHVCIHGLV